MLRHSDQSLTVSISTDQIIMAIKMMDKELQESFIEDLLASVSPDYLESIREARADYQADRVYSHEDVFGEK